LITYRAVRRNPKCFSHGFEEYLFKRLAVLEQCRSE
jgi:hypothetical protein